MKNLFVIHIFLFLFTSAKAQTDTTFYDASDKPCKPVDASFYKFYDNIGSTYILKEFFAKSNKIKYSVECKSLFPLVKNGLATYYDSSGIKIGQGTYLENKKNGIWINWYHSGVDSSISNFLPDGTKILISSTHNRPSEKNGTIYSFVEDMPHFPGGDAALYTYLQTNIKYPSESRRNGVEGRVYIGFIIDQEGIIGDIKVLRSLSAEQDAEAVRVISLMPAWVPGSQNGNTVSVSYTMPINFQLVNR